MKRLQPPGRSPVRGSASGALAVVLVAMAVGPVHAVIAPPSLFLNPGTGPPGSTVAWSAAGFTGCSPADVDTASVVVVSWDGVDDVSRTAVTETGGSSSTLIVPESANLGTHRLLATCVGDTGLEASAAFDVTLPEVVEVEVPTLLGESEQEATAQLRGADLVLGAVTGVGDVVVDQAPPSGTFVEPGTTVDLVFGGGDPELVEVPNLLGARLADAREQIEDANLEFAGFTGAALGVVQDQSPRGGLAVAPGSPVSLVLAVPGPRLVVVPDLVGSNVAAVPASLARRGLRLGVVSGDGDVVRSQNPAAETRVPSGSEVTVSVEPGIPPVRLVPVPELLGRSSANARSALAEVGLVLGGAVGGGDGRDVAQQQPAADTLVPIGSTVTVTLSEPFPSRPLAVVLTLVVGCLAGAGYGLRRLHADRLWVQQHLHAAPRIGHCSAEVTESHDDIMAPTQVVRIEPRNGAGASTVIEVT